LRWTSLGSQGFDGAQSAMRGCNLDLSRLGEDMKE